MAMLNGVIALLAGINRLLLWIGRTVSTILLGVMLVLVLAHVVLRLLSESPSWTEEVTIYMMVWIGFLVAPIAYRAGANVSIEFFKAMLGKRTRLILELALSLLVLSIIIALFWLSFPFIQQGFNRSAQTFSLSAGWLYMCAAYGYGGLIIAILELMLREFRALIDAEYRSDPVIGHEMAEDVGAAGMTGVNPTLDPVNPEARPDHSAGSRSEPKKEG